MLIRSNQLTLNEASSILDSGVYLTEAEAALNPVAVPVLENQRLGICTVSYNDIQRVCEDYGYHSEDALYAVAEASGVDISNIAVAIDESDIILNPEVVNRFHQYVVKPISENSFEYIFTESCLELFLEDYNEDYLNVLLEAKKLSDSEKINLLIKYFNTTDKNTLDPKIKSQAVALIKSGSDANLVAKAREKANNLRLGKTEKKYSAAQIKKMKDEQEYEDNKRIATRGVIGTDSTSSIDDILGGKNERNINRGMAPSQTQQAEDNMPTKRSDLRTSGEFGGNVPGNIKKQAEEAEKSNDPGFISKVVASLRNFYKKFLDKANQEHESGKIAWYKKIARVILNYIDKLLAKLDKTKQM